MVKLQVLAALLFLSSSTAFMGAPLVMSSNSPSSTISMEYVPDGLTLEQYKKLKAEEASKQKNLGVMGPQRFKSRSFAAWQEAGGKHLFPVDPKKVKSGEIPLEKVPYMQRGGAWDNSDLIKGPKDRRSNKEGFGVIKDVKQVEWSKRDKEYAAGGYLKEQSMSIFGGAALPWNDRWQRNGVKNGIKNGYDPKAQGARPGSVLPMSEETRKRMERELAEEARKKQKLEATLSKETKEAAAKKPFGIAQGPFRFW